MSEGRQQREIGSIFGVRILTDDAGCAWLYGFATGVLLTCFLVAAWNVIEGLARG